MHPTCYGQVTIRESLLQYRNKYSPNGASITLPRDSMLARYTLSSCVCPYVTRQYCIKKQLNVESRKKRHMIAQGF